MQRYPAGTTATAEDLKLSGWKAAVTSARRPSYGSIWQSLSSAASVALEDGRDAHSKILWMLADACSMMLKPKSINEPFAPFAVFDGRRSALPEDFSDDDIELLAVVAGELDDHSVRGRIADLVWLRKKPRSAKHALEAIDAYRSLPLDTDTWNHDGRQCWERAISLAHQLGRGAGTRLADIEAALLARFDSDESDSPFFHLSLALVLLEHGLGKSHAAHVASSLAGRGSTLVANGAHYQARSYLEASAKWYERAGDKDAQADMACAVASTWVEEANSRIAGGQPGHIVATSFLESAIQAYRSVPRSLRQARNVDQRIAELHESLAASGKASVSEMGVVSTGPIDISELVRASEASLRGKAFLDALFALANIDSGVRRKVSERDAESRLSQFPMQALFSSTHLSRDGRVIAKTPGIGFGSKDGENYRLAVWAEMVKHFALEIGLIVQGQIWPALQVFTQEHRVREADLMEIVEQSPIVPRSRAALIAKALFAGFDRDLVSCLHLLVPQVEHLVRWHLKVAGVKTTTLGADGIENENGLSALVDSPQLTDIFGEDLAFELKALFCDPLGPNLRNEVAHGLLDHDSCQTAATIYAWWLLLRVTFNTFWNARHQATPGPDGGHPGVANNEPG